MNDYSFLFRVLFLVIVILTLVVYIVVQAIKFRKAQEQTAKVRVAAKTSRDFHVGLRYRLTYRTYTEYYVDFQFEDGRRENFNLSLQRSDKIEENKMGMLTYREKGRNIFFVKFTPLNQQPRKAQNDD